MEAPGGDDRNLARKRHKTLEHQLLRPQCPPGGIDLRQAVDPSLPLPVVARGTGLEHGGKPRPRCSGNEIVPRAYEGVGRAGQAVGDQKRLLTAPILRREEHVRARPDRHHSFEGPGRGNRHVLELVRHRGEPPPQLHQPGWVVEESDVDAVAVPGSRAVGMVDDRLDAVAHPPGSGGEHGAELAATEHAERGPREDRGAIAGSMERTGMAHAVHAWLGLARSSASTRCVCAAR